MILHWRIWSGHWIILMIFKDFAHQHWIGFNIKTGLGLKIFRSPLLASPETMSTLLHACGTELLQMSQSTKQ